VSIFTMRRSLASDTRHTSAVETAVYRCDGGGGGYSQPDQPPEELRHERDGQQQQDQRDGGSPLTTHSPPSRGPSSSYITA
jgi:hypothetical protein